MSEDGKTSSSAMPFNFLIRSPDEWLAYKIFFHWLTPSAPPSYSPARRGEEIHDEIKQGRPSMSAFSQVCPGPGTAVNNILGLPEAF